MAVFAIIRGTKCSVCAACYIAVFLSSSVIRDISTTTKPSAVAATSNADRRGVIGGVVPRLSICMRNSDSRSVYTRAVRHEIEQPPFQERLHHIIRHEEVRARVQFRIHAESRQACLVEANQFTNLHPEFTRNVLRSLIVPRNRGHLAVIPAHHAPSRPRPS